MKFGKVEQPELIDFSLPKDHPSNNLILSGKKAKKCSVFVGCAKWNKQDLKGFYPRGTKDELNYYASQFNSIELNATFYRIFPQKTVENWYAKTGEDFKFFPKIPQVISQFRRLSNCENERNAYLDSIAHLKEKLGVIFLQMHPNFSPKSFASLIHFIQTWPQGFPLALELRHTDWYNDKTVANELYDVLEKHQIANIIVDTAGRRDLIHMKLTTKDAFIRYNGANHESDYERLDAWIAQIKKWIGEGLENLYFFVHQNIETASPLLSKYFIEQLNHEMGYDLQVPSFPDNPKKSLSLF
jgi:uncharacterized protein YecE (DUF72 family)